MTRRATLPFLDTHGYRHHSLDKATAGDHGETVMASGLSTLMLERTLLGSAVVQLLSGPSTPNCQFGILVAPISGCEEQGGGASAAAKPASSSFLVSRGPCGKGPSGKQALEKGFTARRHAGVLAPPVLGSWAYQLGRTHVSSPRTQRSPFE